MKFLLFLYFSLTNVQAATLQDPTKPSSNQSMSNLEQDPRVLATTALKLTAIINNNQKKQAIINGKSFAQGQSVQNYKVILISQNHVILSGEDGNKTLYVNNNNIKKDANNVF